MWGKQVTWFILLCCAVLSNSDCVCVRETGWSEIPKAVGPPRLQKMLSSVNKVKSIELHA